MASILKVDTITGVATAGSIEVTGEGNSTTTNLQQGLAKGWCHANQVSVGITDSFNVSSIADNSDGLIYYTPINNMNNADYASSVSVRESSGGTSHAQSLNDLHTASRWASSAKNNSNGGVDSQHNNIAVHGDLA